ncbi:hypothetical protein [Yimella lutea]|nr:hypothetical protein [Yimella lutea]
MTFLATTDDELLRATALLLLLEEGFVEPVAAPPSPRHIAAQQLLALALQKGRIHLSEETAWLTRLGLASEQDMSRIGEWLVSTGHLDIDQGLAFVGPTAEQHFGRRSFLELLAVFSAPPEVTVLHGTREIGSIDPTFLVTKVAGPRVIALGGRSWLVTHIDWRRRRAIVEPSEQRGTSRWSGDARAYTFELSDAMRRVLLGATPKSPYLSNRALDRLAALRQEQAHTVSATSRVVVSEGGRVRWWTYAGARANAVLVAALKEVSALVGESGYDNLSISIAPGATSADLSSALNVSRERTLDVLLPEVSPDALGRLKFKELLPPDLAAATLAERAADRNSAEKLLAGSR